MNDTQSQPTINNHTAEDHLQAIEALVAKMSDRITYLEADVEYWRNRADRYRRLHERDQALNIPPLGGNVR